MESRSDGGSPDRRLDPLIARHLVRPAFDQERAATSTECGRRTRTRGPFVLDQQHGDIARQGCDRRQDIVALAFGTPAAGSSSSAPRFGGDGDGYFQQPLLAIR